MNVRGVASDQRVSLTIDDAEALQRDATLLSAVVPELSRNQQVKYGNQNMNVNIVGTTANYTAVRNYTAAVRPDVHQRRRRRTRSATPCSARRCPRCSAPTPRR